MSMLAIAARSFDTPGQTFIRDHVRTIAPGQTVLLCEDGSGAERLDCPVLAGIQWDFPFTPIHQRVVNAVRRRWRRYVDPGMSTADRHRVLAFFEEHQPQALLAEFGPTGCLFMKTCGMANMPLYVHFHGYDATILPSRPFVTHHYKRMFANARGIIVTTEFLKQRLLDLNCPEEKISICPCGVDTRLFVPGVGQSGAKTILMVSRLMPQKGPLLSLRSFAVLLKSHPDAKLEIIGDGPLKAECQAEVKKLGISDRVCFHGAQSHEFVRTRLRTARMLIQHCISIPNCGVEAHGLSLLEAMACELPVVSTRHGAIPENVEDGVTGLLVDEYDIAGMASAMAALLDDPSRAAAIGAAGRQRVLERFSLDSARERLRAILGLAAASESQPELVH